MEKLSSLLNSREALHWVPFAAVWMGTRAADRPLLTRAFENLLMAAAAAALGIWANDRLQDYKLTHIAATVGEIKADYKQDVTAIRAELAEIRAILMSRDKPRSPPTTGATPP
jgi:hypothetical protein